jgi:hypothetical protein
MSAADSKRASTCTAGATSWIGCCFRSLRVVHRAVPKRTPDPTALALAPFPTLLWDDYFWRGWHKLRSWAGFQRRDAAYAGLSSRKPSTGDVVVSIKVAVAEDETPHLPSQAQRRAFQYLLDHEAAITAAVLRRVLRAYPAERRASIDALPELEDELPVIKKVNQLRSLIGLGTVHVLPVTRGDRAYIGFELGCVWEEEHGFGVMTHGTRVVAHGGADTAILEWVAERDARPKRARR